MPQNLEHSGFAVIDIGSNSVRMVIYDISHIKPVQIFNEKVYCALGRDLSTTGKLNPQGVISANKAIRGYHLIAEAQSVRHVVAVGTAALRDACDGSEFIQSIQDQAGLSIRVLSGDEEAFYAAAGVMALDPNADGVVADFGGGSLELARVSGREIHKKVSLPLGAFRVRAMEGDCQAVDERIREILLPYKDDFYGLRSLYGIGGSWRSLAQAHMVETGSSREIQGYGIPSSRFIEFCIEIEKMDIPTLRAQYDLEEHKAHLAGVSAQVLRVVLEVFGPQIFVTSSAGVRDGLVHEFLSSKAK
ncbi:MAG: hypothetical protein RBR86_06400 [Pseudobdellovibrionaceae bacterium]|jgi:exopolyphosphatase/guanosine-5'-triphosphate,3'-diphosphate pyrophosphatase|nr:hypothetical protein [Pseudobdellovibrionaceae bacterium]